MFSPQKQQMKICELKSNLEEIGKELVIQNLKIPALDEENEERYRETLRAVQVVRDINDEIEKQNQENMRLTAKRRQLQRNCEEMTKSINKALETRNEYEIQLQQLGDEMEQKIRKYEALLREKADDFRKMHNVYNEVEMKKQLEMVNQQLIDIVTEERKQQYITEELQKELDSIVPDLPDNILAIVGKIELENKLEELTDKCSELREKRDRLQKKPNYVFDFKMY